MADHDPEDDRMNPDAPVHRPVVAIVLLALTAAISLAAVIASLGRDSLSAIAATLGVATALTLIAFAYRSGKP
jgi:hypothetical protein